MDDAFEKLEAAEFDDPRDRRRYYESGDNQIAGVGDGFTRDSPDSGSRSSRRAISAPSRASMSRWCRPAVGSSRMKTVALLPLPLPFFFFFDSPSARGMPSSTRA